MLADRIGVRSHFDGQVQTTHGHERQALEVRERGKREPYTLAPGAHSGMWGSALGINHTELEQRTRKEEKYLANSLFFTFLVLPSRKKRGRCTVGVTLAPNNIVTASQKRFVTNSVAAFDANTLNQP